VTDRAKSHSSSDTRTSNESTQSLSQLQILNDSIKDNYLFFYTLLTYFINLGKVKLEQEKTKGCY